MEDIDRIINGIYSRGQLSGVDGKKPLLNDWKKELKHLINQACNQARIDELEIIVRPDGIFSRSIPTPILFAFKKRIKELKELNNEL